MSHTYVECAVSHAAHREIKALMLKAGYDNAIEDDVIDMHGIALVVDHGLVDAEVPVEMTRVMEGPRAAALAVYRWNPYTGMPRWPEDIASDPQGLLIVPPGGALQAAKPAPDMAVEARVKELEREIEEMRQTMAAAAEEIHEHWAAHCDAEGYGPANLQHRLEGQYGVNYPGYTLGAFQKLEAECNTLRAALARPQEVAGDFVEHSHPEYGPGYFCTPDVFAKITAGRAPVAVGVEPTDGAQNPKFTMAEWSAHARKHRWRFDIETPQDATPSAGAGGSVGGRQAFHATRPAIPSEKVRLELDMYNSGEKENPSDLLTALHEVATPAPSVPLGGGEATNPVVLRDAVLELVTAARAAASSSALSGVFVHGEETRILTIQSARELLAKADGAEIEARKFVTGFYAHPLQAQDAAAMAQIPPMHLADGSSNPEWLAFKHGTLNPALQKLSDLNHELGLEPVPAGVQGDAARLVLPPMDDDLAAILGRMCFQCIQLAQIFRAMGQPIATKAEAEQAAIIYWLLGHYAKSGKDWRKSADEEVRAMREKYAAAQSTKGA